MPARGQNSPAGRRINDKCPSNTTAESKTRPGLHFLSGTVPNGRLPNAYSATGSNPDQFAQLPVAPQFGQARVHAPVPQRNRQQDNAPEHRHRIVAPAAAARGLKRIEQPPVANRGQKPPQCSYGGRILQALPGEQGRGDVYLHGCFSLTGGALYTATYPRVNLSLV